MTPYEYDEEEVRKKDYERMVRDNEHLAAENERLRTAIKEMQKKLAYMGVLAIRDEE